MATQFSDDVYFSRNTQFVGTVTLPAGVFGDAQVSALTPITAPKLEHRFMPRVAQPFGAAATAERKAVHRARAAGTVAAFWVGGTVANVGAATVTVDLLKNGVSILSAAVVLTSSNAAFATVAASLAAGAAYAAADVLEVSITVAAGGGTLAQGVFGEAVLTEAS